MFRLFRKLWAQHTDNKIIKQYSKKLTVLKGVVPVGVIALIGLFSCINAKSVEAAARTEVYIEVGESYSQTYSKVDNAILYKFGDADKKITSASVSNTKLTVKGLKAGNATLYINKNGKKDDSHIVRTVKVHVFDKIEGTQCDMRNNISHRALEPDSLDFDEDETNYTNQPVLLYENGGVTFTTSCSGAPTSVANDTSGKATASQASWIGECKSDGSVYPSGTPASSYKLQNVSYTKGNSCGFKGKIGVAPAHSFVDTWVRGQTYWTSSNGTKHYSKIRTNIVRVYQRPWVTAYVDDELINSISTVVGQTKKASFKLNGLVNGDAVFDDEISLTAQDPKSLHIDEAEDGFNVVPYGICNQTITYKAIYKTQLTQRNGFKYTTFTRNIPVEVAKLEIPRIISVVPANGGLRVNIAEVKGAGAYKIYRSTQQNGGYKCIGVTFDPKAFIDKKVGFGIRYYYKATTITKDAAKDVEIGSDGDIEADGQTETGYSNIVSAIKNLQVPSIESITKVRKNTYKVKIKDDVFATGYQVYVDGKLVKTSNSKTANITMKLGKHTVKVRAFGNAPNEDGEISKKATKSSKYSGLSAGFKFTAFKKKIKLKKPKIVKIKNKKKYCFIKIKGKKYTGFELYYGKSKKKMKKLLTFKNKNLMLTGIKTKKKLFFKVRAYYKVNGKTYKSKFSKAKKFKRK